MSAIAGLRLSACRSGAPSSSLLASLRPYSVAAPVTSRARARSSPTQQPSNSTSSPFHVETTFDGRPRPITIFSATADDLPYPSLLVALFTASIVTGLVISKYIILDGKVVIVGPSTIWQAEHEVDGEESSSPTKNADRVSKVVWRTINLGFPILSLGGFGSLALVLASRAVKRIDLLPKTISTGSSTDHWLRTCTVAIRTPIERAIFLPRSIRGPRLASFEDVGLTGPVSNEAKAYHLDWQKKALNDPKRTWRNAGLRIRGQRLELAVNRDESRWSYLSYVEPLWIKTGAQLTKKA